jgi:hypothetical protein
MKISNTKEVIMPTLLWIILVVLLLGALPIFPYSASWGYFPSSGVGLLLVVLFLLALVRG